MQRITTDIAVIAAGPAGLAAAITAAENDLEVAVFEKMAVPGGTANMGMSPFGVESRQQKKMMVDLTKEKAFEIMMDYTHWNVDARLVHDYFWKSGETIDWLEDMGVQFHHVGPYYAGGYATAHYIQPEGGGEPGPRAASAMIKVMHKHAIELGVKFYMETPVKSIRKEGDTVVGLIAAGKDGEEYEVTAKAVIICTGGFGANNEMIKQYCGYDWGKDLFSFQIPGVTGDGIRMAWEAGAGKGRMSMERRTETPISESNKYFSYMAFEQPRALTVNQLGERIFNEFEERNSAVFSNVIDQQPGRYVYNIMTDKTFKYFRKNGLDLPFSVLPFPFWEMFEEELPGMLEDYPNDIFAADSIEELAEKLGIDPDKLAETVDEYNDACEEGYDDLFLKDRKYLQAIEGKKFYAVRFFCGAYGSLGGIKVNYKLEVLTDDWKKIPGLYGAGTDVNDIYADTYLYLLAGNTMGFALNSGRLAAEHAAEYIEDMED